MKTISERCWKGSQSWNYEKILSTESHGKTTKIKVLINRDAYDHQSHAKVDMWTDGGWKNVCGKSIQECKCARISYVHEGVTMKDFRQDAEGLIDVAMQIIS